MKCIIATFNNHKAEFIINALKPYFEEVLTLKDLNETDDIEETGTSFFENAMIKAKHVQQKYPQYGVLADDSGICIQALNDQPGIFSARFLGEHTSAHEKNIEVLRLLENETNRKARFVCCMVYLEKGHTFSTINEVVGTIALKSLGTKGFGYNPIFIPNGYTQTYGEDEELVKQTSHRAKALNAVIEHIQFFKDETSF